MSRPKTWWGFASKWHAVSSAAIGLAMCALELVGCSSSSSGTNAAHCSAPGGPVSGAADDHCGGVPTVVVDPNVCSSGLSSGEPDAGAAAAETVLYNNEGDDDDCKYHVTWSASAICENTDVTLQVHIAKKADGTGVTGATPWAEVFLGDENHLAPFGNQTYQEGPNGVYAIAPIRFDAKGRWTMKFHFFPDSCDVPESPHGHVAFYVIVP